MSDIFEMKKSSPVVLKSCGDEGNKSPTKSNHRMGKKRNTYDNKCTLVRFDPFANMDLDEHYCIQPTGGNGDVLWLVFCFF